MSVLGDVKSAEDQDGIFAHVPARRFVRGVNGVWNAVLDVSKATLASAEKTTDASFTPSTLPHPPNLSFPHP